MRPDKITEEVSKQVVAKQMLVWTLGFAGFIALFIVDYFFNIFS